jgi:hypothetical protein
MNIKNWFDKIIIVLLTLSIASLIIRKGNFMITFLPKPFEILIVIIIGIFIASLILKKTNIKELISLFPPKIFLSILGLIMSTIVGWLITILWKGISINSDMVFDFGRLILAILVFIFVIIYTIKYPDSFKYYFFALFSPVFYTISIFLPKIAIQYGLAMDDGRFYGLMNNPSTVSKLILISLLFSFSFYLFEQKNKLFKICFFVITIGLMSLIFWSGTRAAILSSCIGFALITFLYIKYNFSKKDTLIALTSVFLIFCLGFLIIPDLSKKVIINRVFTQNVNNLTILELKDIKTINIFKKTMGTKSSGTSETRLTIWPYFIKKIIRNPLGMGPAYYTHTFTRVGPNNDLAGAHNSFLEIILYGGWVAIISFLFLLTIAIKNLIFSIKYNFDKKIPVALLSALVALTIALSFDDHFRLYWFWILLALSISYKYTIQKNKGHGINYFIILYIFDRKK